MSDEVCLLRIGFEEGLLSREDVREWIDREVQARDGLAPELLELTTIAHKQTEEIVALLKVLESPSAPAVPAHLAVAVLSALYRTGRISVRDCIGRLYSLVSFVAGFTDEERSAIYTLESAHDLAEYGTYGTLDEVRDELALFLDGYPLPQR